MLLLVQLLKSVCVCVCVTMHLVLRYGTFRNVPLLEVIFYTYENIFCDEKTTIYSLTNLMAELRKIQLEKYPDLIVLRSRILSNPLINLIEKINTEEDEKKRKEC